MSRYGFAVVIAAAVLSALLVAKAESVAEENPEESDGRRGFRIVVPQSSGGLDYSDGSPWSRNRENEERERYLDGSGRYTVRYWNERPIAPTNSKKYDGQAVSPTVDSSLYAALSKIAKVSVSYDGLSSGRHGSSARDDPGAAVSARATDHPPSMPFGGDPRGSQIFRGGEDGYPARAKTEDSPRGDQKVEFEPRKFHCHPVEDIFVPEVDESMPAYVCKLGDRAFILSSKRFLEDGRPHMDVTLNESTFRQLLATKSSTSENSVVRVIPATLVMKRGESAYGIEAPRRNGRDVEIVEREAAAIE